MMLVALCHLLVDLRRNRNDVRLDTGEAEGGVCGGKGRGFGVPATHADAGYYEECNG